MSTNSDYQTRNYPSEGDTTSEGGYSSTNTFSTQNQRRADVSQQQQQQTQQQFSPSNTGLVQQSLDGGPLESEIQDAKQGVDSRSREEFRHEARRDFDALNPYGRNPDSKGEMGERLASAYTDQRGRQFESGGAHGNDGDSGAY